MKKTTLLLFAIVLLCGLSSGSEAAKYRLLQNGVYDTEESRSIPASERNRHYRAYQEWVDEGNTPDPMPAPDPLADEIAEMHRTDRQMMRLMEKLIQYLIDKDVIVWADLTQKQKDFLLRRKQLRELTGE